MPLDLNSMRCQSQEVARYFGVVLRFLGVICFICGVRSDDAKEFQNNREYYVLYEHKNNLNPKKCVCVERKCFIDMCACWELVLLFCLLPFFSPYTPVPQ